jgi:hypothetical protein
MCCPAAVPRLVPRPGRRPSLVTAAAGRICFPVTLPRGESGMPPSPCGGGDRAPFCQPSLGYEPYDAHLCRPRQSLVGVLTSADGRRPFGSSLAVSPVSTRPAASCAQIRQVCHWLTRRVACTKERGEAARDCGDYEDGPRLEANIDNLPDRRHRVRHTRRNG